MKRLLGWVLLLAVARCVPQGEKSLCGPDGGAVLPVSVSGGFREGKGVLPGTTLPEPFPVVATIRTDVLLTDVTIGGAIATPRAGSAVDWEAKLYRGDLERNREGGSARLRIIARDVCGTEHRLDDEAVVPLGPTPGATVSDLDLQVGLVPEGACSLPANGSVQPLVRVTASSASEGATVSLSASRGTFAGAGGTVDLALRAAGDGGVEQTAFFLPPQTPGFVTLAASAKGAAAVVLTVPVVGAPAFEAPVTRLPRGVEYEARARSTGNLSHCSIEPVPAGVATVVMVDPPLGPVTGTVSVARMPASCDGFEEALFKVAFAANAPDAGALVVRCADTHAQEATVRFTPE